VLQTLESDGIAYLRNNGKKELVQCQSNRLRIESSITQLRKPENSQGTVKSLKPRSHYWGVEGRNPVRGFTSVGNLSERTGHSFEAFGGL
jgi:hypothetical protein